jgi:hypothetical protein
MAAEQTGNCSARKRELVGDMRNWNKYLENSTRRISYA